MPNTLRLLLALASMSLLPTLNYGCVEPAPADDDTSTPPVTDGTECTVEASTYIEDALLTAEKPDGSYDYDDCLAEMVAEGERNEEEAAYECSMLAPANIPLIVSAFAPNAVGCPVPATLAPSTEPHEIVVPLGYGEEAPHAYTAYDADGTNLGTVQVSTSCESGKVMVNTHGFGMYEIAGDQLSANGAEMGTFPSDLSRYSFVNGSHLDRDP